MFNLEVRPEYSHFPWWNHWPVAQIISDGRSAFAPDRAAHSSLSWGDPNGEAALYGMTNKGEEYILDIARSWNNPPELEIIQGTYDSEGYDYTQRAYVLVGKAGKTDLKLNIKAAKNKPVFNPAIVIDDWQGGEASLVINGKEVPEGKDFRQGVEYDIEGKQRMIIWLRHRSEKLTEIEIRGV